MLTHLDVKNYRSLKDMQVDLGPLVVLIGANGSGKSNILDLLRLLQQTMQGQDSNEAFASRGGFREAVWGGQTDHDIALEIRWRPENSGADATQSYAAHFRQDETGKALFRTEELNVPGEPKLSRTDHNWTRGTVSGSGPLQQSALATLRADTWPTPNIVGSVRDWAFYRFNPVLMRAPQPVRKAYRVSETGDNLSTVVHTLFSDSDPVLEEIVDFLKACVPTVERLSSPITEEGRTYVALREEAVPAPVGSWGLSDGTLLALALATALLTPKPPSLIALEAPDTELHPYVMETLAEMLTLASKKTQVIATTHSPNLLNYLPADSFVVVEKTKGATECRPLKGRKGVKQVIKDLGAGEAWYSGHLGGVP